MYSLLCLKGKSRYLYRDWVTTKGKLTEVTIKDTLVENTGRQLVAAGALRPLLSLS